MKALSAIVMTLMLIAVSGCNSNTSRQGGVAPISEEFSITVPSSVTIEQGRSETILISLKRGAGFKQDVRMLVKADGIIVSPSNILIRSGDKPEVEIQIRADLQTAIGDYLVYLMATPESGRSASTQLTVKVISR